MQAPPPEHQPVLLKEALDALAIQPDGIYVDATFGRGGHAAAIMDRLGPDGTLLALDRDPAAARVANARFGQNPRFVFVCCPFSRLADVVERHAGRHRAQGVQGILLDLGVSSPQLEEAERGFSFAHAGPLDMRMDPTTGISAAEWLATCSEQTLSKVLQEFGEERFHRRIARAIVQARQRAPLVTTTQLADLIAAAIPFREPGQHPATRSFQAIRILINQELEELKSVLAQSIQVLAPAGRLVVISFHSLEDRIVKRFLREQTRGSALPPDLPVRAAEDRRGLTFRVIGRALRPDRTEVNRNPRARSAVMRVAERLA